MTLTAVVRYPALPAAAPSRWRLLLAFAAIYLCWGATFLAVRVAVRTIPPLLLMGTRNLIAGLVLYAVLRARGAQRPTAVHWRNALIAGAMLFLLDHGMLAWAEQHITSSLACLLSASISFWLVILARLQGSEKKLSRTAVAGLLIGFSGVALLVGPEAFHHASRAYLMPAGAILLGCIFFALGSLYSHGREFPQSPLLSAAMQMTAGGAMLWLGALVAGETRGLRLAAFTMPSTLALAFLIVFGSLIAFTAYIWLLSVTTPSRVSTYAYVNPVVAVFFGWAVLGEPVTPRIIFASAVILAGVALVNRRASPAASESQVAQASADILQMPLAPHANGGAPIARLWSGRTRTQDAPRYLEYLLATGVKDYRATPGNRGVYVLQRSHGDSMEFLLISLWDSLDAIHNFAGPDLARAVYYPEDHAFLLHLDPGVTHYDISVRP